MSDAADVVVVGGGIAGVSVAYNLAERASVVLVEAERTLAHHTTGRSAAMYLENYGTDAFRTLTLASRSFFEDPPDGLADAPLVSPMALLTVGTAGSEDQLAALAARGRTVVPSIELVDGAAARELCPALRPGWVRAAVHEPDALSLDVAELQQAFVRGLTRHGGRIETNAPVTAIERVGRRFIVDAGPHRIEAGVVVNAAGAWGDVVAAMAGARPVLLRPLRRTAFTVAAGDVAGWPLVAEIGESFYFRPEGPGQLLCSPADEVPSVPCDARHAELDVARAIDAINAATTLDIRSVRRAWAGLRTFAPDRDPVIGFDPTVDGFFWLCGQGGTGIQTAPGAGALAAALILDGAPTPAWSGSDAPIETISPGRFARP